MAYQFPPAGLLSRGGCCFTPPAPRTGGVALLRSGPFGLLGLVPLDLAHLLREAPWAGDDGPVPFPPAGQGTLGKARPGDPLPLHARPSAPLPFSIMAYSRKATTLRLAPPGPSPPGGAAGRGGSSTPRAREAPRLAEPAAASSSSQSAPRRMRAPGPAPGTPVPGTDAREDLPPQFLYTRGSRTRALDIAGSPDKLQAAIDSYDQAVFSSTSAGPRDARRRLWSDVLAAARLPPQVSPDSINHVAAVLREAGYRSAPEVIDQAITDAVSDGQTVSPAVRLAAKRARRACTRGLGPARRTAPFPVDKIRLLPDVLQPFCESGPAWPRRALFAGSWWLTREIELAAAQVDHISTDGPTVTWHFPATKADTQGVGCDRSHDCICGRMPGASKLVDKGECPACAVHAQSAWVRATFGSHAPLFPTATGQVCSKAGMIDTIIAAADRLNLPVRAPNGAARWGGHALRRGGAQHLARAGVEVWRIQALARHSSSAILKYIESAHIVTLKSLAGEAAAGRSIAALRDELRALRAEAAHVRASGRAPAAHRFVVSATTNNPKLHVIANHDKRLTLCGWTYKHDAELTNNSAFAVCCVKCGSAYNNTSSSEQESASSASV